MHLQSYTAYKSLMSLLWQLTESTTHRFGTCSSLSNCTLRSSFIAGFEHKPTPLSHWFICPGASHSDFGTLTGFSTDSLH